MAGLDLLETIFGQQRPGILRFIPPRFFLAIADTIGVVAAREFGAKVAWSDASPDDDGFAPPPLLRIATKEGEAHIPAALHLLTWCIMPLADGEVAPALSEWALDQFGGRS